MTISPDMLHLLIWIFAGLLALNKVALVILFRLVFNARNQINKHELYCAQQYAEKDELKEQYLLLNEKLDKLLNELHNSLINRRHE